MITAGSRIERVAQLQAVGDDDQVDMSITPSCRGHDRHRPYGEDGQPAVDLEAVLVAEVERCTERLEAAQLDLRRWRMSHANDTRPQNGL